MEDLIAELMAKITEQIDTLADSVDVDAIVDSASDSLHATLDAINADGIELDDQAKDTLLSYFANALNGDTGTILENLKAISASPLDFLPEEAEIPTDIDFNAPVESAPQRPHQVSFTGNCFEICKVSVGDGSKRMQCGYHL